MKNALCSGMSGGGGLNVPLFGCSMLTMKTFRHILTRRESLFWFHQNPYLRIWGMKRVFHAAWKKAAKAGCDKYRYSTATRINLQLDLVPKT